MMLMALTHKHYVLLRFVTVSYLLHTSWFEIQSNGLTGLQKLCTSSNVYNIKV